MPRRPRVVVGGQVFLAQQFGVGGLEAAAVDVDPTAFAGDLGAAEVAAHLDHGAVREGGLVLVGAQGVEEVVPHLLAAALHLDRPGFLEAQRPQRDVHVVADPVMQLAAAEAGVPAPVPRVEQGVELDLAGRAAPHLPVEPRRGLAHQAGHLVLGHVLLEAHPAGRTALDALHLAEHAVADQGPEAPELVVRALPAPGLPDPLVFGEGVDYRAPLLVAPGERFLAVDVHPGGGGVAGDAGVPVVGRGGADDIQAGVLEQLAVVGKGLAVLVAVFLVDAGFGTIARPLVDVGYGHDLDVPFVEEAAHVADALAAAADHAHGDAVVGRRILGAQEERRAEQGGGGTGGEEATAVEAGHGGGSGTEYVVRIGHPPDLSTVFRVRRRACLARALDAANYSQEFLSRLAPARVKGIATGRPWWFAACHETTP